MTKADDLGPSMRRPQAAAADRIVGYDVARAWAIFGMVTVHALLVLARGGEADHGWAAAALHRLDGRAAALFVVLAGVGISLRSDRPGESPTEQLDRRRRARRTLVKRGIFLLAVGFLNLVVWPGDILRVYGVSLIAAAGLLAARDRTLWLVAVAFAAGFVGLMGVLDYGRHWDWRTLEYRDLWTPAGVVRNLFYDGFRSVFPWAGLLVFGMWLGRRDVRQPRVRWRVLAWGLAVAVGVELLSAVLVRAGLAAGDGTPAEDIVAVAGTESMPPLPLFLLAAGATAVAAVGLGLIVAARFAGSLPVRAMAATGRMAFTWYVVHILAIAAAFAAGATQCLSPAGAAMAGAGFFVAALVASCTWERRFRHGPLEWLMRRTCG